MKRFVALAIGVAIPAGIIAKTAMPDTDFFGVLTSRETKSVEVAQMNSESEATSDAQMIFDVDFNDETVMPNKGAATEGTNSGTYVESYDGTMAYQFNTSYFKPTAEDGSALLTGIDEFSVTYWANMGTVNGWTFYAAPDTAKQTLRSEKYIGIRDNGNAVLSERYNNSGVRPANIYVENLTDGWKHVAMVQSADKYELYINGQLISTLESEVDIAAMLGDASVIQAGKANWGNGEYATGIIDNYHIYNYALSAEEVGTLYANEYVAPPTPVPAVEWDTAVDSIKTGNGDTAKGTLRFLASVSDDNGYDISNGEYGFIFVNFEPDTVKNDYMGETEIPVFTNELSENTKFTVESIAQSGLQKDTTYYMDIEDIPLSVSKIGVYAVPYVTLEDGFVIYGPPFTAEKFNWIAE